MSQQPTVPTGVNAAAWPACAAAHRLSGTTYYPAFDWLRGASALAVMLHHDKVLQWDNAGRFAVDVFFALSGWLIGGILLQTTRAELPRFFFNRAVRIWVPYYLALVLLLGASLLRDPITFKWLEFVTYKLTFVYNLFGPPQLATHVQDMPLDGTGNHFWSVNAEEQFYLLAPLLLVVAAPKLGRNALTWVAIALVAWLGRYYAPIVFGVLAAVLVNRYGSFHQSHLGRVIVMVAGLSSAAAIAWGLDYDLFAPVCAVSIVLALAFTGERHLFGEVVGGMSYPLYLNHWIGVFVANAALGPFGLRDSGTRQLLAVVISVGMAVALYWFMEKRLLARRRELFTMTRGKLVAGFAYATILIGLAFAIAMR
jgi:peptidoglycan/LPS O-acetylase OafA/YrhL